MKKSTFQKCKCNLCRNGEIKRIKFPLMLTAEHNPYPMIRAELIRADKR